MVYILGKDTCNYNSIRTGFHHIDAQIHSSDLCLRLMRDLVCDFVGYICVIVLQIYARSVKNKGNTACACKIHLDFAF